MLKEENKEKTQKQKHTMKRVLQDIGHYRWMVLLSLLLAGITVALTLYIPILIGKAVIWCLHRDWLTSRGWL